VHLITILVTSTVCAADNKVETVITGLHHPCGIALRPNGTADKYELFIADSAAGRIIKWSNHDREKTADVITGFRAAPARDLVHQTGPLAVLFLDPGLMAVGAATDGKDLLGVYELPEDGTAISADLANSSRHAMPRPTQAISDQVACTSMTRTRANDTVKDALVMIVRSANGPSILLKSRVQAGVLGPPQPFSSIAFSANAESPGAVATSGSGRIVVADEHRITFLNPLDGGAELELRTDLSTVSGLAYSPITGNLYASDFAGGIYRIEDAGEPGKAACRTVKIADAARPTGLAFAPDGALYVTTFGAGEGDGTLQVVTGDL
jgi:sugar lactone lactonase YvrE